MMKNMNLKTPSNINSLWNFSSMISIYMFIQFLMGFFLSMNYMIFNNKFNSSLFIYLNLNFGWFIRLSHSNLTSFIFLMLIIHIYRNLFYLSFINKLMWISGMLMIFNLMLISFLGYTLIWNQMSYWGMMVITNFISILPLFGKQIMFWFWGNFKINIILINRFFSIHFFMPIMIFLLMIIHLNILHNFKSNNPLGLTNKIDMMNLFPLSLNKDMMFFFFFNLMFLNMIMNFPNMFFDSDNFNKMNYFKTPNHIKPEWYFLFFYSILRSIENKISGMLLMILSLMILFIFPLTKKFSFQMIKYKLMKKNILFFFLMIFFFISKLGSLNIEYPYILINKILITFYFLFFIFI